MEQVKPGSDMQARKLLVLKIGTSTLTAGTDRISYAKIEDIARQIIYLKDTYEVIIVSSGAIAAARQFVDIRGNALEIDSKQALSAIGQPKLMSIFDEVFSSFGLSVAQCLLVYRDFESEHARTNIRSTLSRLIELGYTPVINENDTVSADEIIFGDNDKLSALVASIMDADLLALASDINGLYDRNPHTSDKAKLIEVVHDTGAVRHYIQDGDSALGTGGMTTKLQAADICLKNGIEMWILNGWKPNFLADAIAGLSTFTKIIQSG